MFTSPPSILRTFFILQNWNSVPIKQPFSLPSSPPAPGNHQSSFCFCEFDYSKYFMEIEACSICLFVTGLFQFSSVQSLSHVWLFATPWTAARQVSLSIINSQTLLKLLSIESVMPSNHLILCHPLSSHFQSFTASGSFPMSQFSASGGQSARVSASTSVLPMNIQDWSPLGLTGWISLQSKGLSRVFSNTTVQKHQFFGTQLSL